MNVKVKIIHNVVILMMIGCLSAVFFSSAFGYGVSDNNLNIDFELQGTSAEKVYSVAEAQLGLYYTHFENFHWRAWCADFVSACAAAAGEQAAIPGNASVSELRSAIIKRGGEEYSKNEVQEGIYLPQRGDIIIFLSNSDSHVGIVDKMSNSKIYYIDGNNTTDGKGNLSKVNYSNKLISYSGFTCIIHPAYSNQIEKPTTPSCFTATAAGMWAVDLSWDAVDGADEYRIERKCPDADENTYQEIVTVGGEDDSYNDRSLRTGHRYYYRIYAVNSAGESKPVEAAVTTDIYDLSKNSSPVTVADGYYRIQVPGKNLSLSIEGNSNDDKANVHVWDDSASNLYEIFYVKREGGYYTITNAGSGKDLDVCGGNTKPGTNVQQYYHGSSDNQRWRFYETGISNTYFIVPKVSSRLCMLVGGDEAAKGSNIMLWPSMNEAKQRFKLVLQPVRVVFDANGGSVSTASKTVTNTEKYGTLPTPTKAGQTFAGWYTAKAGGTKITENTTVNSAGGVTLYAQWKYTVKYNANGGSNAPEAVTLEGTKTLQVTDTEPAKEGCVFVDWHAVGENGSLGYFKSGSTYGKKQNATLWARYGNTVTYNINSAKAVRGNVPVSAVKTMGEAYTVTDAVPILEGYDFGGWHAMSKEHDFGVLKPGDTYNSNENVTLYAIWGNNITYDANNPNASWKNSPEVQFKKKGESVNLINEVPVLEGYDMIKWAAKKGDITVGEYQPGDTYSKDETVTMRAVWGNNVTYNVNHSKAVRGNVPESFIRYMGETVKLTEYKPTLAGYEFLGWKLTDHNNDDKEVILQPGDDYRYMYVHTLYAVWGNHVKYDVNGGSRGKVPESFVKRNNRETLLTAERPVRPGYKFLGWAKEKNAATAAYASGAAFTENEVLTLYAVWKKEEGVMTLPSGIKAVEAEAFMSAGLSVAELPASVRTIGERAFADNEGLKTVYIYARDVTIAVDAFVDCRNVTIYGYSGSKAEVYCRANNLPFSVIEE